jgi:universal stress protein A
MGMYKHILLATDLMETSHKVVEHAKQLAQEMNARITLIHVVEQAPTYAYGYIGIADIEEELVDAARENLARLGKELNVDEDNQKIGVGAPKILILQAAEELKVDLIILGSHGRHGLSLILGSTANAVINGAHCDVLTIRYKD